MRNFESDFLELIRLAATDLPGVVEERLRQAWKLEEEGSAARMTLGAYDALGPRIGRALVVLRSGDSREGLEDRPGAIVIGSAHPVPDEAGFRAADAANWSG